MNERYPHIFRPIRIGNTVFKNRIWSAPAGVHLLYGREEYPSEDALLYYIRKAQGGAACITYSAQNMDIEKPYDWIHACEDILRPESHRFFSRMTEAIHSQDARVSLELLAFQYHHRLEDGTLITHSLNGGVDPATGEETVAFQREDLERIARTYGDAAEAALKCGFDMILIHGGHGLALSQFYSPIMNRRTDEFSADTVENRMRFADLILDEIRSRVGRRLLIEYRISGSELSGPEGYQIDDCIEMIKHIQDRIDLIHVSTGAFYNGTENITHPTEFLPHGCNVQYAAAVRACPDIHIPVLTLGAFQEPELIEDTLAQGKADIVAMARGLIADADRVRKFRCGKEDEAIPCIRCFHCLDYQVAPTFACSVNPTVGRERLLPYLADRSGESKRVVIIGGGPAGMQCAITAARLGHRVTILERESRLGGKLVFSEQVPFKHDLCRFMNYQIHMVEKLGVQVRLNTRATPELVSGLEPDCVISALGADPMVPPIPGADAPEVISAERAYDLARQGQLTGKRVAVIGGGLVGCETGLYLAQEQGCAVTILEMLAEVATEEMYLTRDALLDRLAEHTTVLTSTRALSVGDHVLTCRRGDGTEKEIPFDLVVLAAGMTARQEEAEAFRCCAPFFVSIGDCSRAANVRYAVRTGYDAANRL